jgi:hypothetical protein
LIDGVGNEMFIGLLTTEGVLIEVNRPALEVADLKVGDVVGKRFEQTTGGRTRLRYSKLLPSLSNKRPRVCLHATTCRCE